MLKEAPSINWSRMLLLDNRGDGTKIRRIENMALERDSIFCLALIMKWLFSKVSNIKNKSRSRGSKGLVSRYCVAWISNIYGGWMQEKQPLCFSVRNLWWRKGCMPVRLQRKISRAYFLVSVLLFFFNVYYRYIFTFWSLSILWLLVPKKKICGVNINTFLKQSDIMLITLMCRIYDSQKVQVCRKYLND